MTTGSGAEGAAGNKPTVLIAAAFMAAVERFLAPEYRVLHGWEPLDDGERASVRAIVAAGEAPLTPAFLDSLPNLGLIACMSVGYDGVPLDYCRERGLLVSHADHLNADDVADFAIGLTLAGVRGIGAGQDLLRAGGWTATARAPIRPSFATLQVGIVGLGAIGLATWRRLAPFGCRLAWWGPSEKAEAPAPRVADLLTLARESDVLIVCARAEPANRGLISAEVIEALGSRGLLVNVARGSLVDEAALVAALKDGRLGGAALDVFEEEPTDPARWADTPNALVTPHMGGGTFGGIGAMRVALLENLSLYFSGQPLKSPVAL